MAEPAEIIGHPILELVFGQNVVFGCRLDRRPQLDGKIMASVSASVRSDRESEGEGSQYLRSLATSDVPIRPISKERKDRGRDGGILESELKTKYRPRRKDYRYLKQKLKPKDRLLSES